MSRKTSPESQTVHGFADVIGVVLLAVALLLAVAQISFSANDISYLNLGTREGTANWIGLLGAYFAWWLFLAFGIAAYVLPPLLAAFGMAYLFGFLGYLRERTRASALWSAVLVLAITGLVHILDAHNLAGYSRERIGATSAGGILGWCSFQYGFRLLGTMGAIIVYSTLCLVSLLCLTNFRLGEWLRRRFSEAPSTEGLSEEEIALERKSRELQKQAKKLEEEVARTATTMTGSTTSTVPGLGQDLKPVPPPNVRDLSVPQAKPRAKKAAPSDSAPVIEPPDEGEVISPRELGAATQTDILGRKPGASEKPIEPKAGDVKAGDQKPEPETKPGEDKPIDPQAEPIITISGLAPVRPKPAPKKPKPITVASTPLIGNYQLPSLDFLQLPDMTVKPTESKEELLANANLMKQTLAQFDIQVELGDITKGPTITRYELHPAPGVKLEKMQALSNNLADALKA